MRIGIGDRVCLVNLSDPPHVIQEQTGYEDIVDGLEGIVTMKSYLDGYETQWWEVRLGRAGEVLLFREEELEVIDE